MPPGSGAAGCVNAGEDLVTGPIATAFLEMQDQARNARRRARRGLRILVVEAPPKWEVAAGPRRGTAGRRGRPPAGTATLAPARTSRRRTTARQGSTTRRE